MIRATSQFPPTWAATKLPIVSNASDPTTRPQAATSALTACDINAREAVGIMSRPAVSSRWATENDL
jgi:hypothetical protein